MGLQCPTDFVGFHDPCRIMVSLSGLVSAGVAVVLSGCGSSDGASNTTETTPKPTDDLYAVGNLCCVQISGTSPGAWNGTIAEVAKAKDGDDVGPWGDGTEDKGHKDVYCKYEKSSELRSAL